jgi:hypothetical protein
MIDCDLYTQSAIPYVECEFYKQSDFDIHESDYETHDCDFNSHELNFNTIRMNLTRTN